MGKGRQKILSEMANGVIEGLSNLWNRQSEDGTRTEKHYEFDMPGHLGELTEEGDFVKKDMHDASLHVWDNEESSDDESDDEGFEITSDKIAPIP